MKKSVLFLCTGNSARSQIAEGLLRHIAGSEFEALSAGLEPQAAVHPLAVQAMQEIGIDISNQQPKGVTAYLGKVPVYALIVVCNKAHDTCPRVWPGLAEERRYYWPLHDPAAVVGSVEEQLAAFRSVRDELQAMLTKWVKLQLEPEAQ